MCAELQRCKRAPDDGHADDKMHSFAREILRSEMQALICFIVKLSSCPFAEINPFLSALLFPAWFRTLRRAAVARAHAWSFWKPALARN